jgi:hypothetical protein
MQIVPGTPGGLVRVADGRLWRCNEFVEQSGGHPSHNEQHERGNAKWQLHDNDRGDGGRRAALDRRISDRPIGLIGLKRIFVYEQYGLRHSFLATISFIISDFGDIAEVID